MSSIDHVRAHGLFFELLGKPASCQRRVLAGEEPRLAEFVSRLLSRAGEMTGSAVAGTGHEQGDDPEKLVGVSLDGREILRHLGDGGFGSVFVARDREPLERQVALKIMRSGVAAALLGEMTEAEWQVPMRLNHPNIIGILAVGWTDESFPWTGRRRFVVSELVDGGSMTAHCVAQGLGTLNRLRLFADVCRAVQFLHGNGVLHGDIKPSNVLVDRKTGVVKVIDFGLSTEVTRHATAAAAGSLIVAGTARFLAPERAVDPGRPATAQDDVYSLGILLGDLLLANEAFASRCTPGRRLGGSARELAEALESDGFERHMTRGEMALFGRGLDDIFARATAAPLRERYRSAGELADDIERIIAGRPVAAREGETGHVLVSAARRHPMTAALLVLLAGVIAIGTASTAIYAIRADRSAASARVETARARWELYISLMQSASAALLHGDPLAANRAIALAPGEHRDWCFEHLRYVADSSSAAWPMPNQVYSVRFGPDGSLYAAGMQGTLAAWDSPGRTDGSGGPRKVRLPADVFGLEVSPDGRLLALAAVDGVLRLVSASDLATLAETRVGESGLLRAVFTNDGKLVVSTLDGSVRTFSINEDETLTRLDPIWDVNVGVAVYAMVESDGVIWCGDDGGVLTALEAGSGRVTGSQVISGDRIHDIEAIPGGRLVAGTMRGELIMLRTRESGSGQLADVTYSLVRTTPITELSAAGEGRMLFSTHGGGFGAFDLDRLEVVDERLGHTGRVYSVAAEPGGSLAASASTDGTVRLWRLGWQDGARVTVPVRWLDERGQRFGVDVQTGRNLYEEADRILADLPGAAWGCWGEATGTIRWRARGERTLVLSKVGSACVAVVKPLGEDRPKFVALDTAVRSCGVSSDGSLLCAVDEAGTVYVVDMASGARLGVRHVALAGDEAVLTSASPEAAVAVNVEGRGVLWRDGAFHPIQLEFDGPRFSHAALTPSGDRLVAGVRGERADAVTLRVYDTATGRVVLSLGANLDRVIAMWFSEDGRRLFVQDTDGAVRSYSAGPERSSRRSSSQALPNSHSP